ncbi:hypothetical protein LCGC14_0463740 [marine sediment metagenome]|uniref:Uncharacterized protein n=1 Tax=marine sediment metagenome TaxID=412755 RepID=A0A0F9V109_9ZZZZ
MQRASIKECSTYTVQLCKAEKETVKQIQDEYRERTGNYLSIPRTIKQIIKEWKTTK